MNRLEEILKQFPGSVKEHRQKIAKDFGINCFGDLENSFLFGAKEMGKKISKTLCEEGITIAGFIDNNEKLWGTKVNGLLIFSPKKLSQVENPKVIITNKYITEIHKQLADLGIYDIIPHYVLTCLFPEKFPNVLHESAVERILASKPEIIRIYNYLADSISRELFIDLIEFRLTLSVKNLPKISEAEAYFPGKFWKLSNKEVFVDVGAYNGDTLKSFLKNVKDFEKYIALEPDKKNFNDFVKSIPKDIKSKVFAICAGAGSRNENARFSGFGREYSLIDKNGTEQIKIIKLDDLLTDIGKIPTTVKIDVEGYEPEVIKGMEKNLFANKPKMAVCVYHRPDHLWSLPAMLININPLYRKNMFLRHHEPEIYGTVLYSF